MDNPITPLDRTSLFPDSGRVNQPQESAREKDRKKFSEELEEEIDEEEQKKKKHDTVTIGQTDQLAPDTGASNEAESDESATETPRHIDLTA